MTLTETEVKAIEYVAGGAMTLITGGVCWLFHQFFSIRDKVLHLKNGITILNEECKACREEMKKKLDDGTGQFSRLEVANNKTQNDLLRMVGNVSEANAKHREQTMRDFISKEEFESRVIAACAKHCKGGGHKHD